MPNYPSNNKPHGLKEWMHQRISAILLLPLVIWLGYFLALSAKHLAISLGDFVIFIKAPFNAITLLFFMLLGFYHGYFGMKIIIEDYVSCLKLRFVMIKLLQIFTTITSVTFFIAIIKLINISL